MSRLRIFLSRLRGLFLKRNLEQELADEIQSHLEMQIEDNQRQGMSPDEARYAALRKFGGVDQMKEIYRDRRGLRFVETSEWGGLMVTLVLSYVGIVVSLPLGVLLALGRRSKMPAIKLLCVIFIEAVRGVPLVTVLFMASFMLPLFVPPGMTFDKFLRALIGVALFASAYMAEVVRGGLQAIPRGQYEGADSLGLGYWQKMGLIIMPQALKLVIPGIVNTFIGMFKDTTLVLIISMFDLLGVVKQHLSDANWATPQTAKTGLVFAALVFWLFCFGMSRYSIFMERRLDTGHKR